MLSLVLAVGCGGGGGGGGGVGVPATIHLKGEIKTTGGASLRGALRAAGGTALVSLYYFDGAGELVPLTKDNAFAESNGKIAYDLPVYIPPEAMENHNFVLEALSSADKKIQGVVPFDPKAEMGQKIVFEEPISPDHQGLVDLAQMAAKEKMPNINMADALSIYPPGDITAMSPNDMKQLFEQMHAKQQEMTKAMNQLATEQQAAAAKLNAYSMELARNPEYMGFDNRDKFAEAMNKKAKELGLNSGSMEKINEADNKFSAGPLPATTGVPQTSLENLKSASEQNKTLNLMDYNIDYFADYYSSDTVLQELKAKYYVQSKWFYSEVQNGRQPAIISENNPFFVAMKVKEHVFQKIDPDGVLGDPDQMASSQQALAESLTQNYDKLVSVPAGTGSVEYIDMLKKLAGMSLPTNQPNQPG